MIRGKETLGGPSSSLLPHLFRQCIYPCSQLHVLYKSPQSALVTGLCPMPHLLLRSSPVRHRVQSRCIWQHGKEQRCVPVVKVQAESCLPYVFFHWYWYLQALSAVAWILLLFRATEGLLGYLYTCCKCYFKQWTFPKESKQMGICGCTFVNNGKHSCFNAEI